MSVKSSERFKQLAAQFLAVTVREQILLVICGLALIIGLTYWLVLEPLSIENGKLSRDIEGTERNIQRSDATLAEIMANLEKNPDEPLREREKVLNKHIEALDAQLQMGLVNLVPANEMPTLLQNMLNNTKGIKVVELRSIAPTAMLKTEEQEGNEASRALNLFRHGISLTLEGQYFDIQRYLHKIEALEWQFYWKKFDYSVAEYPMARVQLELYTLSTNQAFIGV